MLELQGEISEGSTLEELKKNMTDATEMVLEDIGESSKNDQKTSVCIAHNSQTIGSCNAMFAGVENS